MIAAVRLLGLPLVALAIALAAAPAGAAGAPPLRDPTARELALLRATGRPKLPPYVYSREIASFREARLRPAPDLQVRALGDDRPFVLDPNDTYFWVIDSVGNRAVGRYRIDRHGEETSGHLQLAGGGRSRIAGELHFLGGAWDFNNDSGRYVRHYHSTPRNLAAAHALFRAAGVVDRDGRPQRILRTFIRFRRDRAIAAAARRGGFVLKASDSRRVPRLDPGFVARLRARYRDAHVPGGRASLRSPGRPPGRR